MDGNIKVIINNFKKLLNKRFNPYKIILFGSRARDDFELYSDADVIVITNEACEQDIHDYISDCAWEAGFQEGIVVVPVVFSRNEWEHSPHRSSLLVKAVEKEGILI